MPATQPRSSSLGSVRRCRHPAANPNPIVVAIVVGVGSLFLLDEYAGIKVPRPAIVGFPVTILVGMLLWQFVAPAPSLELHDGGFVYKGKVRHFSKLRGVYIGKDSSLTGSMAQGLASAMPWHPMSGSVQTSAQQSVTMEFEDGSLSMKNVLSENNFDDVQTFFGYIQTTFPEITFRS